MTADGDEVARRIPSGQEFSPGQVELRDLLAMVATHGPNRDDIVAAIEARYTRFNRRRAENVLIGMHDYGLYDRGAASLTALGQDLLAKATDEGLFASFAAHILSVSMPGMEVLQVIRD